MNAAIHAASGRDMTLMPTGRHPKAGQETRQTVCPAASNTRKALDSFSTPQGAGAIGIRTGPRISLSVAK